MSTKRNELKSAADIAKVEQIERKLQVALDGLQDRAAENEDLRSEIDELTSDVEAKEKRIDNLEQRLDEVDARTDLLRVVEQTDEMTGKQRSITLLQHLKRAAEKQAADSSVNKSAKSSVTREQAEIALQHPDVDRTTIYDDMRRTARLVGDEDVCWYDSQSGGESRLWLNLEVGALPVEFNTGE